MSFFRKSLTVVETPCPESERVSVGVVGVGQMGRHHARILAGLWALMEREAEQKNWPADQWRKVLRSDVEISAQGLDHWLGPAS